MSIQAMAWAFKQTQIADPMQRYVLLCLANYAGEDGKNAFPSVGRLSRDSGLSDRTVQRALHSLKEQGVISEGNQAVVAGYIPDETKRPLVYDLVFRPVTDSHPVTNRREPVTDSHHPGVPQSPNPSSNRKITKEAERGVADAPRPLKRGPPPVEEVFRGREVIEGREPTFAAEFRKRFGTDPV